MTPVSTQKITFTAVAGAGTLHTGPCVIWGFTSNRTDNDAEVTIRNGTGVASPLVGVYDAVGVFAMTFPGGGMYLENGLYVDISADAGITFLSASLDSVGGSVLGDNEGGGWNYSEEKCPKVMSNSFWV